MKPGTGTGMRYAGGQSCPGCDATLGAADYFCRWCGRRLRGRRRTRWGVTD